tara:strand:+ start:3666 stop:3872 length:207 start_codon:yes stop_codon:yes gene_type:complete
MAIKEVGFALYLYVEKPDDYVFFIPNTELHGHFIYLGSVILILSECLFRGIRIKNQQDCNYEEKLIVD